MSEKGSFNCRLRERRPSRLGLVLAIGALALAGCADEDAPGLGQPGYVGGFFGAVVSDEPNATLIGQEVLSVGGSAADAAVAVGFALGVTMPNRAGPGSHGACMVHDAALGVTEALDFVAPHAAANRPVMPTFSRGMAALHARYGRLPWRGLVSSAEQLARLGHRPSRATQMELEASWPRIAANPVARTAIGGETGTPPDPVRRWQQVQLAGLLGQIRFRGAGVLHTGTLSRSVQEGYRQAGADFTLADLQTYLPVWRRPAGVLVGEHRAYVLPPPSNAGVPFGQALGIVFRSDAAFDPSDAAGSSSVLRAWAAAEADFGRWSTAQSLNEDEVDALLSDEAIEALSARTGPGNAAGFQSLPPIDSGATGYVVVDREGMAVACTLTLGKAAGTASMPSNLGFFAASAGGGFWNSPVVVANDNTFQVFFAGAGDGAAAGLSGLLTTVVRAYRDGVALRQGIAEPRVAYAPRIGAILEASGVDAQRRAATALGLPVRQTQTLGRINAVYCPSGLPVEPEARLCGAEADPRAHGLTALADWPTSFPAPRPAHRRCATARTGDALRKAQPLGRQPIRMHPASRRGKTAKTVSAVPSKCDTL